MTYTHIQISVYVVYNNIVVLSVHFVFIVKYEYIVKRFIRTKYNDHIIDNIILIYQLLLTLFKMRSI